MNQPVLPRSPYTVAALFLATLVGAACADSRGVSGPDDEVEAVIPAAAWSRYAELSRERMAADRALIQEELRSLGQTTMTRAPYTDADFSIDRAMTDAWFRGATARSMADNIVSFQTPTGGWSKHVDYTRGPRKPGQSFFGESDGWDYIGTIDNGATVTELRFLARAYQEQRDERWRASFLKGIDYLLLAQYPNGCWPQVYPLMGGYHDAATFNDDAITNVLTLLRDVGQGGPYAFVPKEVLERVATALARGVDCLVASQVRAEGVRTAWGQQHDARTLAPTTGRSYELPGLSSHESARLLAFLMSLPSPDSRVVTAVHSAAAWFQKTAIHGYGYDIQGGLRAQAGAGPIWARIAEVGTNRPIFANRDGIKLYDFQQLTDRRTGYAWFSTEPAKALREHESWAIRYPR